MHNLLIKKFKTKYDFPKLGFPKLKNFLESIDYVFFDRGNNISHIKACLNLVEYEKNQKNLIHNYEI